MIYIKRNTLVVKSSAVESLLGASPLELQIPAQFEVQFSDGLIGICQRDASQTASFARMLSEHGLQHSTLESPPFDPNRDCDFVVVGPNDIDCQSVPSSPWLDYSGHRVSFAKMSEYRKLRRISGFSQRTIKINSVLHGEWDPIRCTQPDEPVEYSSYIWGIEQILDHAADSIYAVSKFLLWAELQFLQTKPNADRALDVAASIVAIREEPTVAMYRGGLTDDVVQILAADFGSKYPNI